MSTPTPNQPLYTNPTPEDLAGTPVCIEEDSTTRVGRSSAVRVRGHKETSGPGQANRTWPPHCFTSGA